MIFALALTTMTIGARTADRVGPRPMMAGGMLVAAAGMVLLAQMQVSSDYAGGVLPGLVVVGMGLGLVFAPAINASTAGVFPRIRASRPRW